MQKVKGNMLVASSAIIVQLVILLICGLRPSLDVLFNLSLLLLILQVLTLTIILNRILNLPNIVLVLSYILHMSAMYIEQLYDFQDYYMFVKNYNYDVIYNVVYRYMIYTALFMLGSIIATKTRFTVLQTKTNNSGFVDDILLRRVGLIYIIIGFIPKIILDFAKFRIRQSVGYVETYSMVSSTGLGILSYMFYFGVIYMLISFSTNQKKANMLVVFSVFIETLALLSGHRYNSIAFWTIIVYIYINQYMNINISNMWKYIALAMVCVYIIVFYGQLRQDDGFGAYAFLSSSQGRFENIMFSFFAEMGNTARSLIYSYIYVPNPVEYAHGLTYVKFFLKIIPGIERFIQLKEIVYQLLFPDHWAIGGSWIGEIWYNFQYLGFICVFIMGLILEKIESLFFSRKNIVLGVNILFPLILFLRGNFEVFRYTIYFIVFQKLLIWGLRKIKKNKLVIV